MLFSAAWRIGLGFAALLAAAGCSGSSDRACLTPTPSVTPLPPVHGASPTPARTAIPSATETPSVVATASFTLTPPPSLTPAPTRSLTPTLALRPFVAGGLLHAHGQPLIPVGVYFWPDVSKPRGRNPFEDIAAYGLDALVAYYEYIRPDRTTHNQPDIRELRRECERLGIYFFLGAPGRSDLAGRSDADLQELFAASTDPVGDSPFFVGWMFDEPAWNGIDLSLMERSAAAIRRHPAASLVWINFAPVDMLWDKPEWPDMTAYARIGDIVGFDFYPVETGMPWEGHISRSRLEDFGWYASVARELAGAERPVWMMQQGYRAGDMDAPPTARGRRPDGRETRFMTFQAIARGASGIFFFPGSRLIDPIPEDDPTWGVHIRQTAAELRQWRSVLASGDARVSVSATPAEVRVVGRKASGQVVIVAVREAEGAPIEAVFRFDDGRDGIVTVPAEARSIPVKDGVFSDTFGGYDVRLYVAGE